MECDIASDYAVCVCLRVERSVWSSGEECFLLYVCDWRAISIRSPPRTPACHSRALWTVCHCQNSLSLTLCVCVCVSCSNRK